MTDGDGRARFPYMPFYVDDWITSDAVASFTLEQRGAYVELLLRQWKARDGVLPKDDATLARLSGLGAKWRKLGRPIIARCFVERRGGLVNERCRSEWEHAREKSKLGKRAAAARWGQE